jgi:glycosyltransferase involved in cell wall biosynthesis
VLVSELGLAGRVSLTGHLDEVEVLRKIYARAFVSVSPGFAGLAITQSFAFGVPMLIADNEPHAPEIEAAAQGENCAFFASDDPAALAAGLLGFYRDRFTWIAKGPGIAATCASRYSVEVMAEGIVAALTAKSCVRQ